ncbi:MAG: ChaN family lipoprotein [Leptospira sp.]|nr:ChaN family lipoprotein [Leptospira sp.]
MYSPILIFFLVILFDSGYLFSQEENSPGIIDSSSGEKFSHSLISERLRSSDVLLIGEEHDDVAGHSEKLKLLQSLAKNHSFVLSLEIFEKDQQLILDEYLDGHIQESKFNENMRLWKNYESAYKPIVEFAKVNKIRVIAANTPRRYVNLLSRGGMDKLKNLSKASKAFLPPLYMIKPYIQKEYDAKLKLALGDHMGKDFSYNTILAQHLWDAGMMDAIAKEVFSGNSKIVHINGRYHSDEGMGVTHRLRKIGINVLTISMLPAKNKTKDDKKFADIIYYTGK